MPLFISTGQTKLFTNVSKRYFSNTIGKDANSTISPTPGGLDTTFLFWFAGFTDAEGCFLILGTREQSRAGIRLIFKIGLHKDDIKTLEYIQNMLGVGRIEIEGDKCTYTVTKFADIISVIIPIFTYTKLFTKKYLDFLDFKSAALIKNSKTRLTQIDRDKIIDLKEKMNTKRSFVPFDPNNPYQLQPGDVIPTINIYWLIGFIEGDGSFSLTKSGVTFSIGQKYVNTFTLRAIELFLSNLPNSYGITIDSPIPKPRIGANKTTHVVMFQWSNIDSLFDYILPLLQANFDVFVSRKKLDFMLWSAVLSLNKTGLIYTPQGKDLLIKISSNLNQRRYCNNNSASPIDFVTQEEINRVLSLPPLWDLNSGLSHVKLVMKSLSFIRNKNN